MKGLFSKVKTDPLDKHIISLLDEMLKTSPGTDDYSKLVALLERLYALKAKESRTPVSRDTIALVAGNLLGILLIVAYEQKHVMTSKGFNQLIKPKTPFAN